MSRKTILIIEGEPQVLRLLSWVLAEEGYGVDSVSNPLDATNHVVANCPDVVIFNTGGNAGGALAPVVTPLVSQAFGWMWGIGLGSLACLGGVVLWFWIDPGEGECGLTD